MEGSLGAVCEEMSQGTSCRAGRNWAAESEEAPGPAGTGRDRGLTEGQRSGCHPAPPTRSRQWSLSQPGCLAG